MDDLILSATNTWLSAINRPMVRGYRGAHGRPPDIACPSSYTERMFWRKVVDRNPDFAMFSDKLATKDYLRRVCPELPVPRTLWVGSSAADIPDELLQQDVFVKANHGSSFNFRTRGRPCERAELCRLTNGWLATNYGVDSGEWPYALVQRKLFVEEPVGDAGADLLELSIRASNGKPILGSVLGKSKLPGQWAYYLDADGAPTWGMSDPEGSAIVPLPPGLNILEPYRRAVQFTRRLSIGVDYARFDFFWNGTRLYGGEITLFPAGGTLDPTHSQCHRIIREGWDLRESHFLKTPQSGLKRIYAGALRRRLNRDRAGLKNNHPA
ncbi:MAG: hypothetical protein P4N60_17210 [Verrucomicrobiae bacterium]|nr:hypothetical protein [Verrucomicrobiae bacterium]